MRTYGCKLCVYWYKNNSFSEMIRGSLNNDKMPPKLARQSLSAVSNQREEESPDSIERDVG
ncbi:hypothetical protein SAMN05216325_10580 [Nitrosomonas marina]|uniref:Uncharacterized protein n=1 Tax=Nitrosomonas marina TaxID=917 RepID=A0A1H8CQ64_9PROT|nr:hypothetical protein SAMN05216325_10580 [Nitrosomonas marina]